MSDLSAEAKDEVIASLAAELAAARVDVHVSRVRTKNALRQLDASEQALADALGELQELRDAPDRPEPG